MKYIVMLFFILSLLSCQEKKSNDSNKKHYPLLTIKTSEATLESHYPCVIKGKQNVDIRPQVSRLITDICVDEGATVKKGDALFIIDQVPYKAALASAEANVRVAKTQMNTASLTAVNKKALYKEGVISEYDLQTSINELEATKAALEQAQAEENNARNNLSYTILKSPVDGVCGMIPYRIGTLVSPSMEKPLVTVSNMDEMYAYFSITERQLLDMMQQGTPLTGRTVKLTLNNGTEYKESGHINAVSGTIDSESGVVRIRVAFLNPEGLLHDNGSGMLSIQDHKKDCIVIPLGATYEIQDHVYVYKVVAGKTCATKVSVTRLEDGKHCMVNEGLELGDVIIAEGAGLLRDGIEVEQ